MKPVALTAAFAVALLFSVGYLLPTQAQDQPAQPNAAIDAKVSHIEELAALNQWAKETEATHDRVHKLWTEGARGGSADEERMARYYMCLAQARLAAAQNEHANTRKWYARAATAADDAVDALQQSYNVGLTTLDVLLLMQQNRAETKLALARLQQ